MLRAIVRTSPTIRSAARSATIIAAAVALILPMPARCLSCSAGADNCSRCQATHSATAQPSHRSCCEHRIDACHRTASTTSCLSHVQAKTCGCKVQVPDRTYVAAERQTVPAELVAILPSTQPLLTVDRSNPDWVTASSGNLPPSIPHRILHCSWII